METLEPTPLARRFLATYESFAALGRKVGMHRNRVQAIATGAYPWTPSWRTWCKFAKALGDSPGNLRELWLRTKEARNQAVKAENCAVLTGK